MYPLLLCRNTSKPISGVFGCAGRHALQRPLCDRGRNRGAFTTPKVLCRDACRSYIHARDCPTVSWLCTLRDSSSLPFRRPVSELTASDHVVQALMHKAVTVIQKKSPASTLIELAFFTTDPYVVVSPILFDCTRCQHLCGSRIPRTGGGCASLIQQRYIFGMAKPDTGVDDCAG